jgi:hypothetical protein
MKRREHASASVTLDHIKRLTDRAAKRGVTLDTTSAKVLAVQGPLAGARRLDDVCRLIHAAHNEDLELSFRTAMRRVESCAGNVEEAIRRASTGGREDRDGIAEAVEYAAERGLAFAPRSIDKLFSKYGRGGTRHYIDKLSAIIDAAAILRIDCTQTFATRRLALAQGDEQRVIADFQAEYRRRADRQKIKCRVIVPPCTLKARANAFAGCGCPNCCERLATQLQSYINKIILKPLFNGLDRDEARCEANLEMVRSAEKWPGGPNFAGYFAERLERHVKEIYASRAPEEQQMLSLDAAGVLANDDGGHTVPLGERIPDRTTDVITIVLLRERVAEAALQVRQARADRAAGCRTESPTNTRSQESLAYSRSITRSTTRRAERSAHGARPFRVPSISRPSSETRRELAGSHSEHSPNLRLR